MGINITQEKFEVYDRLVNIDRIVSKVRIQSIINKAAEIYAEDLNKDEVFELMKNFNKYEKKYGERI